MATESPMRMVETSGAGKWASSKDSPSLTSPFNNAAEDELLLLLNGHKFHGDQTNMVVNRSGSAPPCMEGSFVSFRDLISQQNSSLESLKSALENCQSEEKMIVDPSNLSSYLSNLNLNPRLSPSIRQVGGLSNSLKITSIDDSVYRSFHLSRGSLSTHDEEQELDGSPSKSSNDWGGSSNAFIPGQDAVYPLGHHKSLVDLIQEDFPRTPSPVYNQSHSSSHGATEEQKIGLNILSHSDSKSSESPAGSVIHDEIAKIYGLRGDDKSSVTSFAKKFNPDKTDSSSISPIVEIIKRDADKAGDVLSVGATGSEASRNLVTGEDNTNEQDGKNIQHQIHHHIPQQNGSNQIHEPQAQVFARALNLTRNPMDSVHPNHSKLSSSEAQLVMQPPGLTPPLYATAAAYIASGNPFFPASYPPGLYAPQYGFGGYTFSSSFLPSLMASYPPHTGMPVHFDANSGQGFNARGAGASTGENAHHIVDRQHLNKFSGQQGFMVHPPFLDLLKMQYFQHPVENGYGTMRQYGHVPTTGVIGAQVESFTSPKESNAGAYVFDQKLQASPSGSLSIAGPRNGGLPCGYYYGSPQSLNVMSQFSGSPLGSPVPPGSPVGGAIFSGVREISFPQDPTRNVGVYPAWQGRRGFDSFNDPKKHSLLEELKSSNTRKIGLSDITGRIVEFSVDQHGSRFIQQKLENCRVEEKATVFNEVLPHASRLVTDVFGNYVIQKFFEHGTPEQRKELANQLSGQMLPLSLQMYGCRVIQKALEVIELDQRVQLAHELDGNVMRCVQDQNGNHVIQKCIECIPAEKIGFIISAFQGQVATLSTHPYGCRVIQRILEHCSGESHSQCIVDEILESAYVLAQDQYGNYVTQHVLERGKPQERSLIIRKLAGKIVQMSQQKYASNVVEKCLEHGDTSERELLIEEILRQPEAYDHLLTMMKDQFANYVVQKILEISNDKHRGVLLKRISEHLHALKKYTYGKHIVSRFEQLCGEGEDKEAVES